MFYNSSVLHILRKLSENRFLAFFHTVIIFTAAKIRENGEKESYFPRKTDIFSIFQKKSSFLRNHNNGKFTTFASKTKHTPQEAAGNEIRDFSNTVSTGISEREERGKRRSRRGEKRREEERREEER